MKSNDLKKTHPCKDELEINLEAYDGKKLLNLYKRLCSIRSAEIKLAEERKLGIIGGPVHLSVGQEAIAVGISENLNKNDRVFGAHRSHSHILAINLNFKKLFAEVLGKKTGFSKGMGGSMHLISQDYGFYGSVPIVAGTVPIAVGTALEAKFRKNGCVSVAYIGDGAIEEGIVHESLNLAKMLQLPVIFVVENNFFASHMNIKLRQPSKFTSRFAEANHIENKVVDGNNVLEVLEISKNFIERARNCEGPFFLEAFTYRWYGHVDWREDIDVGLERSKKEIEDWKKSDPINRLEKSLFNNGILDKSYKEKFLKGLELDIKKSWQAALDDPYPDENSTLKFVYYNEQN